MTDSQDLPPSPTDPSEVHGGFEVPAVILNAPIPNSATWPRLDG